MRRGLGLTLVAAMLAGACGGGKSPTEPSTTGTTTEHATGPSATITGAVQGATAQCPHIGLVGRRAHRRHRHRRRDHDQHER